MQISRQTYGRIGVILVAVTGFRIVVTAGMGRFLRVYPLPNRETTRDEQATVLNVLGQLWPNQNRIEWTPDEQGVLASHGKALNPEGAGLCAQMLYVGTNGRGERITDEQAIAMVAAGLRRAFPDVQI